MSDQAPCSNQPTMQRDLSARWFSRSMNHHLVDLRDVARGVEESNVGLCTRYLIDRALEGARGDEEVRLADVERWLERHEREVLDHPEVASWNARLKRCRRSIRNLRERGDGYQADVLCVAFGYPAPLAQAVAQMPCGEKVRVIDFFGRDELVALVLYTDAVEGARLRLVEELTGLHVKACEEARAAEAQRRYQEALADGLTMMDASIIAGGIVVPGFSEAKRLMHAMTVRKEWVERGTGSSDALRWVMSPFAELPPVRRIDEHQQAFHDRTASWHVRQKAHDAERTSFLVQARKEADLMLASALEAYHDAWIRNP